MIDFFHALKMAEFKYFRKYYLSFYIKNAIINLAKAYELAKTTVASTCWFGSYQPKKPKYYEKIK